MGPPATIGIHNDFAARDACVPLRRGRRERDKNQSPQVAGGWVVLWGSRGVWKLGSTLRAA